MNGQINVLIVEDEPLILDVLRSVLESVSNSNGALNFKIKSAIDCDTAYREIEKAVRGTPFDLVLLDINIPPSRDRKLLSGEDLGLELKGLFPKVKIIVFTSHNENYRLNNILKTLNPDGFLIKSEIDFKDLIEAINGVLNNIPYYSKTILRLIRRHVNNDFILDKLDRQLLYQLSKGTKTKDLPNYINLSKSGIELRKRKLKEIFCIEGKKSKTLIEAAIENGYL
ncbi:response regulator transcription factor [Olleya sp. AH-315-K02]|nr:response regulator transcription factor [Olleya sp. AH-315-K02]